MSRGVCFGDTIYELDRGGCYAALLVRDADTGLIGLKPAETEPPSEAE